MSVPEAELDFQVEEARVNEEHNQKEGVNDSKAAEQLVEGGDDIKTGYDKDCLK